VEGLADADWQSVVGGMDALIKDDYELLIGAAGSADSIVM